MSETERRIESLEAQVAILREALISATDWSPRVMSIRASESARFRARLEGQERTRAILKRLG